jgi:hypothetical protein
MKDSITNPKPLLIEILEKKKEVEIFQEIYFTYNSDDSYKNHHG